MVLFLVFLQKGSFVSFLGSTVIRAICRQASDHANLVRMTTGNDGTGNDDDETTVVTGNAFSIDA